MARQDYRDLSKEQIIELLKARDRKKFGLVLERDAIEHDKALNVDFVALDPVSDLHTSKGIHENLIIEGDNFDALRALRIAYSGKVKCIYIDPPYNTGNRDFVYNDRFVDKDHNWRHSMWIEFMFQRLTLARDLLAQDGAIFVSIDDNEIFHLGMLLNEVFGEGNFVATCIWHKRVSPSNDAKYFSTDHDYIMVYALCSDKWRPNRLPLNNDQLKNYSNPDGDERGVWNSSAYTCAKSATERPNLYPEIRS
jgi:adenine-specific DNA-methyltransferase